MVPSHGTLDAGLRLGGDEHGEQCRREPGGRPRRRAARLRRRVAGAAQLHLPGRRDRAGPVDDVAAAAGARAQQAGPARPDRRLPGRLGVRDLRRPARPAGRPGRPRPAHPRAARPGDRRDDQPGGPGRRGDPAGLPGRRPPRARRHELARRRRAGALLRGRQAVLRLRLDGGADRPAPPAYGAHRHHGTGPARRARDRPDAGLGIGLRGAGAGAGRRGRTRPRRARQRHRRPVGLRAGAARRPRRGRRHRGRRWWPKPTGSPVVSATKHPAHRSRAVWTARPAVSHPSSQANRSPRRAGKAGAA